ncbi:hypothetical protein FE697_005865 [Mumia zhuanghuii]|uniref:Copper(I)-binding protein n=2 Tax=Mumia TaxID=1546255 RepID=A0ABW1QK82_9ACTN|nr:MULTISPECIES: hypothetical protein [Mumia]KAA1425376.1 hypothetical protein FE697_005865 [Mumia zhuanghuii]
MLSRSRRALVAVIVGAIAVLVTGCGTGFNAQTSAIYQAGIGSNDRSGDVDILNALFVKNEDGSATLSAGLVNQALQTDRLVGVEVMTRAGTPVEVTFDDAVALPIRRLYTLGLKPSVVISGEELFAGQFVTATFTFANAGQVQFPLPIVTRTPMYDAVAKPAGSEETTGDVTAEDEAAEGDAETHSDEGDTTAEPSSN